MGWFSDVVDSISPTSSIEKVIEGEKPEDVLNNDLAAREDFNRQINAPVRDAVLEANQGLVQGSESIFGNELTQALSPTGVALDRMYSNHESGQNWNDSFANSFDQGIADIHNRTADTVRNTGDFLGEDDGEGTLTGLGSFIDRFSDAESKNVQGTNAGVNQMSEGSFSKGLHTIGESQDDFWSDPVVQNVALTAASMGAAAVAVPYIVSTLGVTAAQATAIFNMGVGAARSAASGGSLSDVATGAAGSALGSYAGGYMPGDVGSALNAGTSAAASDAIMQALKNDGDIDLMRAAQSGLTAAGGAGISGGLRESGASPLVTRGITNAATSALGDVVRGRDINLERAIMRGTSGALGSRGKQASNRA